MDELRAAAFAECLARIEAREPAVGAWAYVDLASLVQALAQRAGRAVQGPLDGVLVGVKDMFDTADMPTGYGSPLFAAHRPREDAWVVQRLRAAGAVVAGKTVSTEFAYLQPGKTAHPLDPSRTAGGSSSGSAAAVAAGMVPLAIGTQTAGSTLRPAAYCGVYGYKPTHGLVPLAGCRPLAPSLDTVGLFARTLSGLADLAGVLSNGRIAAARPTAPRIRWLPMDALACDAAVRDGIGRLMRAAAAAGAQVAIAEDFPLRELVDLHHRVMAYEAAQLHGALVDAHADQVSAVFQALVLQGRGAAPAEDAQARHRTAVLRQRIALAFADFDVLVLPSAGEEAPVRTAGTGNPDWCRPASLLGFPALSVPIGLGAAGLPIGVQLVGRPHGDTALLGFAQWLAQLCTPA